MIPSKELQELAAAIKKTPEYIQMAALRRNAMLNPRYGRQMYFFEREHARLYNMGLPEAEISARLKKLYSDFRGLLEAEEIKKYVESARAYQKLVTESIAYLNKNLELNRAY